MRKILWCMLAWSPFLVTSARATVVFDTIGNTAFTTPAPDFPPSWYQIAASFTSDSIDGVVNYIGVQLQDSAPTANGLQVTLFTDNAAAPGVPYAPVGSVTDSQVAAVSGPDIVGFNVDIPVAQNTRYWVLLSTPSCYSGEPDTSGCSSIQWDTQRPPSGPEATTEYLALGLGVHSNASINLAMQMEVDEAPEPASFALGALGLGLLAAWGRRRAS